MSTWLSFHKYGTADGGHSLYAVEPTLLHIDALRAIEPSPSGDKLRVIWNDLASGQERGAPVNADIPMITQQLAEAGLFKQEQEQPLSLRAIIPLSLDEGRAAQGMALVPTSHWRVVTAVYDRCCLVQGTGGYEATFGETPSMIADKLQMAGHRVISIGQKRLLRQPV
jgi:hypothetical protein